MTGFGFVYEIPIDNRKNRSLMEQGIRALRQRHCEKHGIRNTARTALVRDTVLRSRKIVLSVDAEAMHPENTTLFTGQCLIKEDEELDCPVTLQDAIECAVLRDLLEKQPMQAVCMYPDLVYQEFMQSFKDKTVSDEDLDDATSMFVRFRQQMLPQVQHVRISDCGDFSTGLSDEVCADLSRQIRRIYGGRVLQPGQEHGMQKVLFDYGCKTVLLPEMLGIESENIIVFGEPGEVCSVRAAQIVANGMEKEVDVGLIGYVCVPSLERHIDRVIDMYSARREARIHLNESDSEIRQKVEDNPSFCASVLGMSPLTPDEYISKEMNTFDRGGMVDELIRQVNEFRRYLE